MYVQCFLSEESFSKYMIPYEFIIFIMRCPRLFLSLEIIICLKILKGRGGALKARRHISWSPCQRNPLFSTLSVPVTPRLSHCSTRIIILITIMPPTLRAYFRGPQNYAYDDVLPGSDDVCLICEEPYKDEPAIRLLDCGHIVGLRCFREWIQHQPDKCPSWAHVLLPKHGNSTLLEKICNSDLFADFEDSVYGFVARVSNVGIKWENSLRPALNALHEDRLDSGSTATIFFSYGLASVCILLQLDSLVLCIALAADSVLGGVFFVEWLRVITKGFGMGLIVVFMAIIAAILWLSLSHKAERRGRSRR